MAAEIATAMRSLARRPGYFAAAVLLIALGIGASSTAFTLVRTLFYQPRTGLVDAARIYNVHREARTADPSIEAWSYPDYRQLAQETRQFASLCAFTGLEGGFAVDGQSRRVMLQLVSANFFPMLGAHPALGRFFQPEEESAVGVHPVAVISHRLWREQLAADPAAIGRTVKLNGQALTVVGVAEPGFHGTFIGFDFDVWLPLGMARVTGMEPDLARADTSWLELVGRLAPAATAASAQSELDPVAQRLAAGRPVAARNFHVVVKPNRPIDDDLRGSALGFVGALSVIAGLVLLTACLNVSSLMVTRAEERRRESAVRLALGCGRGRLVGEWLAESLVIFAGGGILGLLLSQWIADLQLFRQPTAAIGLTFDFQPDWAVFAFCLGVTLIAGLATGLLPAWRAARTDLVHDLKTGHSRGSTGASRTLQVLVVAQLAFSIVPLVAAGLLVRTLGAAARVSPGFATHNLLITELNLTLLGDDSTGRGAAAARHLLERVRSLPGVSAATLASRAPLGLGSAQTSVLVAAPVTAQPPEGFLLRLTQADADYFSTLQIPLKAGRAFTPADQTAGAPPVAILNETAAHRLFGARDPLDRELRRGDTVLRVVGVVPDVKYSRLWEEPEAQLYLPLGPQLRPRLRLIARTSGIAPDVQRALQAAEPDLPLAPPLTATEQIALTMLPQTLGTKIAAVLGGLCLLLAAIGLYGVLALGTVQQTREFGVRIALGAQPSQIVALVARRVALLTGTGLLLGGALAYGVSTILSGFVHGVAAVDPLTYAAAVTALTVVALGAAWLPMHRATKVDPLVALRAE